MKTVGVSTASRGVGRQAAVAASVVAIAIAAAWSNAAWSQPGGPGGPAGTEMRHGPHGGGHGMRGMHGMRGGGGDELGMAMFRGSPERMERRIDRMLDGLQATDAQRAEIKRIARSAADDLRAQHQQGRALRDQAMAAFTAPTVDAAAVERARQQRLAQHDAASKRMTQAMLDVARVLTPEQRAKVAQRLADHRARMDDRMKRLERDGRGGPEGRGGPRGMAPPAGAPSAPRS